MAKKHHKPEEIVAKLRQVEVLVGQGKAVAEAVRAIGVTIADKEPHYHRGNFCTVICGSHWHG